MSKSKVCICIPCYNNESTIAETLNSVVNQSYDNIVVKVFDNASTDKTRDIASSYSHCGRTFELNERDTTITGEENFNFCITASEGEYCAIFHSDDVYDLNIIAEQVDFLDNNPECNAVSTHASLINKNGKSLGERFVPVEISGFKSVVLERDFFIKLSFKYGNFITCPSVLFRTDMLKKYIKSFNGNIFKSSADLNVWFRITEKGSFGFINKPLMKYRISDSSFSYHLARARTTDHDLFLVLNDYLENSDISKDEVSRLIDSREFLLMKDRANTNLNKLILNQYDFNDIKLKKNVKLMMSSRFHFKFFMIACITKLLVKLPMRVYFVNILKKIKFGNA